MALRYVMRPRRGCQCAWHDRRPAVPDKRCGLADGLAGRGCAQLAGSQGHRVLQLLALLLAVLQTLVGRAGMGSARGRLSKVAGWAAAAAPVCPTQRTSSASISISISISLPSSDRLACRGSHKPPWSLESSPGGSGSRARRRVAAGATRWSCRKSLERRAHLNLNLQLGLRRCKGRGVVQVRDLAGRHWCEQGRASRKGLPSPSSCQP